MARGRPIGRYAKADAAALLRGEALQLMALLSIEKEFVAESDLLNFQKLSYDNFMKEWDKARIEGREDEFYAQAAQYLAPAIQQVMAQMGQQGG